MMYNVMKNLIDKKYYPTREEAQDKIDVFFAYNRLTQEEYAELCQLIEEKYGNTQQEPGTEEKEEITE